jgi:hypothetical protein
MAFLRSPLGKGLKAGVQGLSQELTRRQVSAEEDQKFEKQQAAMADRQRELAMLQFTLQQAGNEQTFARQQGAAQQERQFKTMQEVTEQAGDTSKSLPGLVQRAKGVGVEDEFIPGGGSRINMPGGRSFTHYARPMNPDGQLREERSPIEELIRTRQQAEQQEWQQKIADFEQGEQVDETGTKIAVGPGGRTRQLEADPTQAGARAATIARAGIPVDVEKQGALMPGAVKQAGAEAGARAHADPKIVGGMNPLTGEPTFARVRPTGNPELLDGLAPRPPAQGGDSTAQARAGTVLAQLNEFDALSQKINTAAPSGRLFSGVGSWMSQAYDPTAEEYNRIRLPMAMNFAVLIQGSRPTDKDVEIAAKAFPDFFTSKPVAQNLMRSAKRLLETAIAQNRARGIDVENMTPEELMQAADQGLLVQGDLASAVQLLQGMQRDQTQSGPDEFDVDDFLGGR